MAMDWEATRVDHEFPRPESEALTEEFDRAPTPTQVHRLGVRRDQEANRQHVRDWLHRWLTGS